MARSPGRQDSLALRGKWRGLCILPSDCRGNACWDPAAKSNSAETTPWSSVSGSNLKECAFAERKLI
jgi:hypothetical protein